MGLDSVAIVMEVEERFGLAIADEQWMTVATPRQVVDLIERNLTVTGDPPCQNQRAFYLPRRALMALWGVERKEIRLETQLRDHVAPDDEAGFWQALRKLLGTERWPEWVLPSGLQ